MRKGRELICLCQITRMNTRDFTRTMEHKGHKCFTNRIHPQGNLPATACQGLVPHLLLIFVVTDNCFTTTYLTLSILYLRSFLNIVGGLGVDGVGATGQWGGMEGDLLNWPSSVARQGF